MRSAHSASLGVEVEKILSVDRARGAILFEYRIHNLGQTPLQTAPWQITRVAPGGLTFYPSGEGHFAPSNLHVREEDGVTWFDYDKSKITGDQKLFADGREGWLAHVDRDALMVKTFPVAPRAAHAPGEAQIEIYANPAHTYIEVEVQGAYETIPPGGALVVAGGLVGPPSAGRLAARAGRQCTAAGARSRAGGRRRRGGAGRLTCRSSAASRPDCPSAPAWASRCPTPCRRSPSGRRRCTAKSGPSRVV